MATSATGKRGFTIVELIVVVCIIALLATVTVFAFGSWRQRTATVEVTNALTHLNSSLNTAQAFANGYPAAIPASYQASSTVTIVYTPKNLTVSTGAYAAYCARATSTAVPSVVYYISDQAQTPSTTAC